MTTATKAQQPIIVAATTTEYVPPPTSAAPTVKLCADASYNYYQATEDCSGYIYCTAGVPDKPYPCGEGMLYDEKTQRCNWADEVTCGDAVAESDVPNGMPTTPRPTNVPTPPPTNKPNPLLEWSPKEKSHGKTVIGYYASWQWYDRNGLAAPKNFDFHKVTRVNFAFFQITTDGYLYGTDEWVRI